ncbi:MAG: hypothetical protein KatS3mg101_0892 [Patescibacteria group bacterium]|nr:MAG: hypothetical protein KatS3mg101_0892 [Patescibacteria group bacterium]
MRTLCFFTHERCPYCKHLKQRLDSDKEFVKKLMVFDRLINIHFTDLSERKAFLRDFNSSEKREITVDQDFFRKYVKFFPSVAIFDGKVMGDHNEITSAVIDGYDLENDTKTSSTRDPVTFARSYVGKPLKPLSSIDIKVPPGVLSEAKETVSDEILKQDLITIFEKTK